MAKQGALSALSNGGLSELWARLRFLFLAIVVYRIGAHIPVPGINPDRLADLFRQNEGTILSLFNMFSGGALERMSIFALGIMPYISASIIMQLMTVVSPQLEQLKKEQEYIQFATKTQMDKAKLDAEIAMKLRAQSAQEFVDGAKLELDANKQRLTERELNLAEKTGEGI